MEKRAIYLRPMSKLHSDTHLELVMEMSGAEGGNTVIFSNWSCSLHRTSQPLWRDESDCEACCQVSLQYHTLPVSAHDAGDPRLSARLILDFNF